MELNKQEPVHKPSSEQSSNATELEIKRSLRLAANNPKRIQERIQELETEWNLERTLELNAGVLSLAGIILAATVHRRWLILPVVVSFFLAEHAMQGWSAPVAIFRKLGYRTAAEINAELNALKMLRGDFGQKATDADLALEAVRKR